MRTEQITNEADSESIRIEKDADGSLVVSWCPCDADGNANDSFGWIEIARRDADGEMFYADEQGGESWTEARTNAVNDLLRML